ncbi:MAG: NnrS family protein, partial [Gammaproteobacteria bacterium]|nr:NnrS family protein [Gammaproteobacteria bacterium]
MGETKKELELELESNIKGDISNKTKMTSFSLFALGFRPFFFFAAILSVFIMSLSLVQFSGKFVLTNYYTSVSWHAHEMLFGYTVAVIAGFLFTAVGNWTGIKVIAGWQLIL